MKTKQHENVKRSFKFPSTHWSSIILVAQEDKRGSRDALNKFAKRYGQILHDYLRRWYGLSSEEADDYVQGFFADRIIERGLLANSKPKDGRLRTLLLVSLFNYMTTGIKREAKVRERHRRVGIRADSAVQEDPSIAFSIEWARWILKTSLESMKQECETNNRMDLWTIFLERLILPAQEGRSPTSYKILIQRLGLKNPMIAGNLLITAKRAFDRALRNTVSEYTTDAVEIESELADLRTVFSQASAELLEVVDQSLTT